MKNLLRVLLIMAIISCQETQQSATEETADGPPFVIQDSTSSMYAVSLATAEQNVQYYDSLCKASLGIDPIRAFTIRSVDLVEVMGMKMNVLKKAKYRHVRIYMGLDESTGEFKIYLTPVKGAKLSAGVPGTDVILNGPYSGDDGDDGGDGELADGDGPYVFDFSKPCPNACDPNSPLNN
ncbi:hypothetical protein [Ekhidna sp.]